MLRSKLLFCPPTIIALSLCSCGDPDPSKLPVINTPANAKVDLSQISLTISKAKITRTADSKYSLSFDYTITNQAGAHLAFVCLYDNTDELIEINLTDPSDEKIILGKRPMEGLTLTQPRPIKLLNGSTTRHYKAPITPTVREAGDSIKIRVRLHAPSRYDELRSSIEAPTTTVTWP